MSSNEGQLLMHLLLLLLLLLQLNLG